MQIFSKIGLIIVTSFGGGNNEYDGSSDNRSDDNCYSFSDMALAAVVMLVVMICKWW